MKKIWCFKIEDPEDGFKFEDPENAALHVIDNTAEAENPLSLIQEVWTTGWDHEPRMDLIGMKPPTGNDAFKTALWFHKRVAYEARGIIESHESSKFMPSPSKLTVLEFFGIHVPNDTKISITDVAVTCAIPRLEALIKVSSSYPPGSEGHNAMVDLVRGMDEIYRGMQFWQRVGNECIPSVQKDPLFGIWTEDAWKRIWEKVDNRIVGYMDSR